MWVLDIPHREQEGPLARAVKAQERAHMRNRFRSMRPGATNMKSLPPVDVVVRCGRSWNCACPSSPVTWRNSLLAVLVCAAASTPSQDFFGSAVRTDIVFVTWLHCKHPFMVIYVCSANDPCQAQD
jgi:hypothetical protein